MCRVFQLQTINFGVNAIFVGTTAKTLPLKEMKIGQWLLGVLNLGEFC